MKKAILDQLFLGFLLLMGIVTFVATVNDETSTRDYIYDLKALAKSSSQAMARYYEENIDMCTAQTINTAILNQQKIGQDALSNGLISYTWWDTDSDGEPDQVTTTIAQHPYEIFWYKFFGKNDFTVGPYSWTEPVNTPVTVQLSFDSEDAGYNNMMGTYQLDANNCVTNTQLLLQNSNAGLISGQAIGSSFTSPPTYVFLLSQGYDTFTVNGDRPKITDTITVNNHCFSNATSNPSVTLNGKTVTNTTMYFEHTELNGDGGYAHIQLIPKNVQAQYEAFIGGTNANEKYQLFIAKCQVVNYDNDPYNNIPSTGYVEGKNDCTNDANDQYLYAMEDLDGGGDQDFNDLMLNSTRDVIPNQSNTYTVNSDGSINLTCDNNSAPTLTLNCFDPNSTDENTSKTFDIINSMSDSDGTITSITGFATNGTVLVNNPSITYTPHTNYFGQDTISITVTDNDGTSNTQSCTITVNEVNEPPTISGTPMTTIEAGSQYKFSPMTYDSDGDTLTFSISNMPSWASFDTTKGILSGVPSNENVGVYSNIIISVSDGVNPSVSLSSFSITVTKNSTNNPPICSIPNQSSYENQLFSINLDDYCTDQDGDDVTYSVSTTGYSGTTSNTLSYTIPTGASTSSPLTINIMASDGIASTRTSFTLTISANTPCTINETDDFSRDNEGWSGGNRDSYYEDYVINPNNTGYKTYYFGSECKNVDVNMNFYYWTNSWEDNNWDRDYLEIYLNNSLPIKLNGNYDGTKTLTTRTDEDGNLKISFKAISDQGEYMAIDNIKITK